MPEFKTFKRHKAMKQRWDTACEELHTLAIGIPINIKPSSASNKVPTNGYGYVVSFRAPAPRLFFILDNHLQSPCESHQTAA